MMDNVQPAFDLYPKEKITGIWACYFNSLRSIMSKDGVMTTSKLTTIPEISLIKSTSTPIDFRVELEDYDRCVDLLHAD